MGTSVRVIVLLISLRASLSLVATAFSVSFPVTYIDAESSSVARGVEADPARDLPTKAMPYMRGFVAAGRAMRMRAHAQRQRTRVRKPLVGKLSYERENAGDFYLSVPVGTPPQRVLFLVDTGSEFIWSHCSPCKGCSGTEAPPYAPNRSSSFLPVPWDSQLCRNSLGLSTSSGFRTPGAHLCNFAVAYGDHSTDAGYVSVDYFHLGPHFSKPIVFGCATVLNETVPTPSSGLMGLSAGPFSFPSQLFGSNPGIPKKFAHCLPDRFKNLNAHGTIEFGNYELPVSLSYTPFVPPYSPLGDLYYYVHLNGITVGESWIKVAMKGHHEEGLLETGGTIFDSGTSVTILVRSVYNELVKEMKRQTAHLEPFASQSAGSDLCYKVPLDAEELPKVPKVTLHFEGMVNQLELGPESILLAAERDDKGISLCLAFDSTLSETNIIGNYQQQNYWVEYNLETSSLGLAKARCAK